MIVLCYPKCSTCRNALKWLSDNAIEVKTRHIVEQNPTVEELRKWISLSGLPVTRFFNTSGILYRERGIKDIVKSADETTLINLLAENGMLVKRPIVVNENFVLVGFRPEEWKERFLSKDREEL